MGTRKILLWVVLGIVIASILVFISVFALYYSKLKKEEDRIGYRIVIEGDNSKDILLRLPCPYLNGNPMVDLVANLEQKSDPSAQVGEVKTRLAKTKYGYMVEVKVSELSGKMWLDAVKAKPDLVSWSRPWLNLWLNPYIVDGDRWPNAENIVRIKPYRGKEKETAVYTKWQGSPLNIDISFGAGEVTFLGTRYHEFGLKETINSSVGWLLIPLQVSGQTSF